MRKVAYLFVAGALVFSACSDGDSSDSTISSTTAGPTPTTVATISDPTPVCVEIADQTITMLQDMIMAVEALPADELPAGTEPATLLSSLDNDTFLDLRGRADSLGLRGQQEGCTEAEGQTLVLERVNQLQATTAIGETLRAGLISGIEQTQIN